MINYYKKGQSSQINKLEQPQPNSWINISPPFNPENLKKVSEDHDIPLDFLTDSLDIDERSRYEVEDEVVLIVLKTPIPNELESDQEGHYITIPLGIIVTDQHIITLSAYDNPIIEDFVEQRVKRFDPGNKDRFILQIFDRTVSYFLRYLRQVNNKRNLIEQELYTSMQNEQLSRLLDIEKSLVYFVTALRSNELMMIKLKRTNILTMSDDELDLLEDIIVDCSQALEMANIYTTILSSTMDAFASIINNNLNTVMRRLTSVTIILMLPTLVASFYGMNVELPFQHSTMAFVYTLLASFILVVGTIWFFAWKRWF